MKLETLAIDASYSYILKNSCYATKYLPVLIAGKVEIKIAQDVDKNKDTVQFRNVITQLHWFVLPTFMLKLTKQES